MPQYLQASSSFPYRQTVETLPKCRRSSLDEGLIYGCLAEHQRGWGGRFQPVKYKGHDR